MEAKKLEELCERVKIAEHYIVFTVDKNDECSIHLKADELEMRCMLFEIVKQLEDDDKQWLLQTILLELNKKGKTENEQQ